MSAARRTVFIVDDDEAVRHSLKLLLDTHGYDARAFATGAAFLAAVGADSLGCLVLDSGLRDMSSLDVAAALRARSNDLPIILTAAVIDARLTKRARRLGIHCVLNKPWDCAELFKLIDEAQGPQTQALQ
jgi:FixJ family two-component response regulator